MPKVRNILIATALWGATIGCAYAGFWLSGIVISEETMRSFGPALAPLAGIVFFVLPFAAIALGAFACWRTFPAKNG